MGDSDRTLGERVAAVEARLQAQDSLLSDFKNRFATIEAKLDRMIWKVGLIVGLIAGAAGYAPDLLKSLAG